MQAVLAGTVQVPSYLHVDSGPLSGSDTLSSEPIPDPYYVPDNIDPNLLNELLSFDFSAHD